MTNRAHIAVFAALTLALTLAAMPAGARSEAPPVQGTGETLLLEDDIARSLSDAGMWGLRMGLLVGWAVNGIFVWLADDSLFSPYPAVAALGWLTFEAAAAQTPPVMDASSLADQNAPLAYVLRANMGLMAGMMIAAAYSSLCTPFGGDPDMVCFERAEIQYSLSWSSGFGRLMTRPVNLAVDLVWKRFRGEAPRNFQVLVAPVMHLGQVTGGGLGIQFTL